MSAVQYTDLRDFIARLEAMGELKRVAAITGRGDAYALIIIDLQPDSTVLLYAAALSVLTGILVGLGPARHALRADLGSIMKQETAAGLGGRGRLRNLMIGAQVAACLTLLMGAGLLWRGVRAAARVDPGFETRKVYVVAIPPDAMGRTATEQALSRDRVQRALRSAPQFQSVAMTMNPPLLGHMTMRVRTSDSRDAPSLWNEVSPEFFETLGIPVMRGRTFTRQEAESHAQVVMVSENGARFEAEIPAFSLDVPGQQRSMH